MTAIQKVKRATASRTRSEQAWKDALREARDEGVPLRTIAEAAGISHVRVLQILRGE
jgi:transposase-like protein